MELNQHNASTDYLKAGTPIALRYAGTHFLGVVEDDSNMDHDDRLVVMIYDATTSEYKGVLPIRLSIPCVSRRIRWKQLNSPTPVERERLMRAKAALQATSCLTA